jgi:hypothetical protein
MQDSGSIQLFRDYCANFYGMFITGATAIRKTFVMSAGMMVALLVFSAGLFACHANARLRPDRNYCKRIRGGILLAKGK